MCCPLVASTRTPPGLCFSAPLPPPIAPSQIHITSPGPSACLSSPSQVSQEGQEKLWHADGARHSVAGLICNMPEDRTQESGSPTLHKQESQPQLRTARFIQRAIVQACAGAMYMGGMGMH